MSRYYRAVAVDYDGTLTESDTPSPEVLAAIRRVRGAGRLVVLVTGRILDSLLTSFPEAELSFDAIVAENGGLIWLPGKGREPDEPPFVLSSSWPHGGGGRLAHHSPEPHCTRRYHAKGSLPARGAPLPRARRLLRRGGA